MKTDADGSFSDGLRMNVFPQAMALANIHIGTMAGKLNGVMPATTPRGWRIWYTSMPVLTCSLNPPLSRCGMPVANSRFSSPRATSPSASERTLPCSRVRCAAISSRCWSARLRMRNMISVRLLMLVARQPGKASCAMRTASLTSSVEAKSTSRATSPVAGLKTDPLRPLVPATRAPLIQWLTRSSSVRSPPDATGGSATWVMKSRALLISW